MFKNINFSGNRKSLDNKPVYTKLFCLSNIIILLYCLSIFARHEEVLVHTAVSVLNTVDQTVVSDRSYIIKHYDTLWDLAFKFFGDPFLWPEIWNANSYIRDPHWIYPDNALVIPGISDRRAGNVSSSQMLKEQRSAAFASFTKDFQKKESEDQTTEKTSDINILYDDEIRTLIEKGYWGSDLLRQIAFLWTKRDEKNIIAPGNAYIDGDKDITTYRQFDRINCTIFGGYQYAVGDTIEVIHPGKYLKFKGKTVNLVHRVALGRVEEVNRVKPPSMQVTLFKVWDVVKNRDRVAPMRHFDSHQIDTVLDADEVIEGNVFKRIESTASPYLFQTFIIDRGSRDGVQLGDIFLVYPVTKKKTVKEPALLGCALHIQEESSSLVIMKMYNNRLAPGDEVKLVKRIKFN